MVPFPQVQRLAADTNDVADVVVVDVLLLLGCLENDVARLVTWADHIHAACTRGGREVVWLLSKQLEASPPFPLMLKAVRLLQGISSKRVVVASRSSFGMSVSQAVAPLRHLGGTPVELCVVGAGYDERPHQFWMLADFATGILDLATGLLHTRTSVAAGGHDPECVLRFLAIRSKAYRRGDLSADEAADVLAALRRGLDPGRTARSQTLRDGIARRRVDIDAEERRLLGYGSRTSAVLSRILRAELLSLNGAGYVAADLRRDATGWKLRSMAAYVSGRWWQVEEEREALRLLRDLHSAQPDFWFGPRMLDLLAWMNLQGLPTPTRALDIGMAHQAICSDADWSAAAWPKHDLALKPRDRRWMLGDPEADLMPNVEDVSVLLPRLHRNVERAARREGVNAILSELSVTIPELARVEARGLRFAPPRGYPNWNGVLRKLQARWDFHCRIVTGSLGARTPFLLDKPGPLLINLRKLGIDVPLTVREGVRAKDQLKKVLALPRPDCTSIRRVRALDALMANSSLWNLVSSAADRAHTRSSLASTGRVVLRDLPLQTLVKSGPDGALVRGFFHADPGMEFVAVDYNAFELRLLAALSGDSILVRAAQHPDLHLALAREVFGPNAGADERGMVKEVAYAWLYGQSEDNFVKKSTRPPAQARSLFQRVSSKVDISSFQSAVRAELDQTWSIRTPGGWRRTWQRPAKGFKEEAYRQASARRFKGSGPTSCAGSFGSYRHSSTRSVAVWLIMLMTSLSSACRPALRGLRRP